MEIFPDFPTETSDEYEPDLFILSPCYSSSCHSLSSTPSMPSSSSSIFSDISIRSPTACKKIICLHDDRAREIDFVFSFPTVFLYTFQQCCGPVTFWYGSGSSDSYLCLTDSDADPESPKTYGAYGSGCGSGLLVKSHKKVTKQQKSRFFLLFLLDDGGSGAGSVLVTNGSECGFPEAQKHTNHTDPDPDPQHCI